MEGDRRQYISISALFAKYRESDNAALRRLEPLVYEELRRLARAYMRRERRDHTLQVTGLVNEAVARLVGNDSEYSDAHHFYATAARIMRHVLVDYAKARRAEKRGGDDVIKDFPLNGAEGSTDGGIDLIELDEARKAQPAGRQSHRITLLRRTHPARNIQRARHIDRHGVTRSALRQSLAAASTARRLRG